MQNLKIKPFHNPLIFALDVDTESEALKLVDEVHDLVGGFKIGPRLNLRYGNEIVKKIAQQAPVFVDNKHFDIPSTMEFAVRASFEAGASLVTVHGLSGREALQRMAELESELNAQRPFRILGVTILTSWTRESFCENFKNQTIPEHVLSLLKTLNEAGLKSLVCSPLELEMIQEYEKQSGSSFFKVTPGIRSDLDLNQDQKRVMNAQDALELGSDLLVVGRPILQAPEKRKFVTDYLIKMLNT